MISRSISILVSWARTLQILALGALYCGSVLQAEQTAIHNPYLNSAYMGGVIALSSPVVTIGGDGSFTATVKLDVTQDLGGATLPSSLPDEYFTALTLVAKSGPFTSPAAAGTGGNPLYSGTGLSRTATFTFTDPKRECECKFTFEVSGTTTGSTAISADVTADQSGGDDDPSMGGGGGSGSSGGGGGGGAKVEFGMGKAGGAGDASAGKLSLDAKTFSEDLYSPRGLQESLGSRIDAGDVTKTDIGGKQVVTRVKSDSRVLDVKVDTDATGKYSVYAYDLSQAGEATPDTSLALRKTTVENPGSLVIAGAVAGDYPLYHTARWGSTFGYRLPIANGSYRVQLHFAELYHTQSGRSVFDVKAESAVVIDDLDPYAAAGAGATALVREFDCTVADGELTLDFAASVGGAFVSAIRVTPVLTPAGPVVLAIKAGGPAFTANDATAYEADRDFSGGKAYRGGDTRMRVTISQPASPSLPTRTFDYEWKVNPATNALEDMSLLQPGGLRKESLVRTPHSDGLGYDETRTLANTGGTAVSVSRNTYRRYPFGERRTIEVLDPAGAALTTTWSYGETVGTNGYSRLVRQTDPAGRWQTYAYDGLGRLVKTVTRHLASTDEAESANRVETTTYAGSNPVETRVTTVLGQEVARSYVARFESTGEIEVWNITATTPAAAWDAASNLVSKSRSYTHDSSTALLRGRTKWTRNVDDTVTVYTYAQTSGNLVTTRDTGTASVADSSSAYAGSLTVTAGTRIVTTTNPFGQQIAEETRDIASNLVLSDWSALTVDALGRPTLIGYGDGTTRELAYRGSNAACGSCSGAGESQLAYEIDRNGVRTDYAYDALERRTQTTRLGVTEKLVHDAADHVIGRSRIGSDDTEIVQQAATYDLAGRVISTTDALGNVTDYSYTYPTGGGLVTTTTYPATTTGAAHGTRIETTYADGRTKEISGTAVSPVKYAYGIWTATGQAGEWTQEIKVGNASAETEWTKTYADLARRTVKIEYPATTGTVTATMAYNALGQLEKQTDPDGVQTLFAYNAKGEREVTAIDLDQDAVIDYTGTDRITKTTTDVYSRSGTIVRRSTTQVWATDASNTATTVSVTEQDGYGNASWQTDAAGVASSSVIARTAPGSWTVTATAPDTSQQIQTYTGGRLASSATYTSTSVLNLQTTYAYDAQGRLSSQTDSRTGDTDYTYSDRDEVLTVITNNAAETTAYTYDALGSQLTITRPDASVTTNEYYLRNNQLKKTSGSQTYPVEYTYDLHGRMKTFTTWQNSTSSTGAAVTTWTYDAQRGWLTQKLYADNTGPAYTYTPAGRLLTRTWARTSSSTSPLITTYGYTAAGDLTSTDYSDTTPDVAMTYTRFGAQHTVTDATGTRTFTYTAALRPDQEQLPAFYGDRILTRSYETSGGAIGRSDGFTLGVTADLDQDYDVVYDYDTAGRLSTVTDPSSTYTYAYTTNSNLRHTVTGPVHVATTSYETYRNVISTVENKVGITSISKYDYTVNNLGQRTQRANTGTAFGTTSTDVFTYNAKGEVTGASNATLTTRDQSFVYDDIGNRLTFTQNSGTTNYTANSLNAYTAIGSASPTHDADGNQTATGTGQVYIWDAENRLVLIEPVIPSSGDKKQLNVYDAQSRRVRKQVSMYVGGSWSLTTDEKFIYDGWNLVAVLDAASSNALLRTYTWGLDLSGSLQGAGGVGGLLSAKDGSSVYHYTYDANGNVSEVLNNSGGIAAHYEYDAFGSTVASSGTYAATNAYRFSTKPLDDVSGLYYYGLRYYNPSTGRWLSRDPIGERGGVNLYGYVYNNPVKWVDPLGLDVFFNQENESGGHAWTSIGGTSPTGGSTYGEYPNGSLWGNNASVLSPDPHYNDDDFSYDQYQTTPEDEAALQQWIKDNYDVNNANDNKNNPKYRLGWEDCRSFNKRAKNQLEKIIKDRKGKINKSSGQIPKTPGSP